MSSRIWLIFALWASACACGARSSVMVVADAGKPAIAIPQRDAALLDAAASTDAARDAAVAADADPQPTCDPPLPAGSPLCVRCVRASAVSRSEPSCWVDEVVSHRTGYLAFACAGGPARLVIGEHTFVGQVYGDQVDVRLQTFFDWSDGCAWQSSQRVTGPLSGPLTYSYSESPLPGETGCLHSCSASAQLDVWQ